MKKHCETLFFYKRFYGISASLLTVLYISTSFGMPSEPNLPITGQNPQIVKLMKEKNQKMTELEQCAKKVTGFKIAGISTLGLTAVGVAGNVMLSGQQKGLQSEIASTQKKIEKEEEKQSKIQTEINKITKENCVQDSTKEWVNGSCVTKGTQPKPPANTDTETSKHIYDWAELSNPTSDNGIDQTKFCNAAETGTVGANISPSALKYSHVEDTIKTGAGYGYWCKKLNGQWKVTDMMDGKYWECTIDKTICNTQSAGYNLCVNSGGTYKNGCECDANLHLVLVNSGANPRCACDAQNGYERAKDGKTCELKKSIQREQNKLIKDQEKTAQKQEKLINNPAKLEKEYEKYLKNSENQYEKDMKKLEKWEKENLGEVDLKNLDDESEQATKKQETNRQRKKREAEEMKSLIEGIEIEEEEEVEYVAPVDRHTQRMEILKPQPIESAQTFDQDQINKYVKKEQKKIEKELKEYQKDEKARNARIERMLIKEENQEIKQEFEESNPDRFL